MTGESMAERCARKLEPDWTQKNDDIRARSRELGSHHLLAEFDAATAEYGQTEWGQRSAGPMEAFVATLTEGLVEALADLGADPARLRTVHVVPTLREDMTAEMRPFADGSGLVVISDSIITLCGLYGESVAVAMSHLSSNGRMRRFWRAFNAARKGAQGIDVPVLTSLLRYHNVNQRVYNLAAKLGLRVPPDAEMVAQLVMLQSARFVIGHELAHHVLGHDSAPSGFFPGEHLPACSDDQQRELAADLLAQRAVVRATEAELGDTEAARAGGLLAVLGGVIAMLAVHSAEQALFVRRGVSHPPASQRASLLLAQTDPRTRRYAEMFLPALLAATAASSMFSEGADVFDGDRALASPMVSTPLPRTSMRAVGMFDTLQCLSNDRSVQFLERARPAISSIGEGARLAAAGNAAAALREWGVSEESVRHIVDPWEPLTFHSLLVSVREGLTTRGLDEDMRLSISVVAARLVAMALES
ncbi:hypothetical protein ABZ345_05295 [Lentzea sp. NPDC005914]|uniref:hypothetical protein n=1 Tax=Lentzea sp. NPDC005914 TaxID=3154572 RepID=UPI00340B4660